MEQVWWCLLGQCVGILFLGFRMEGVVTVREHSFGRLASGLHGLQSKVAEHGVGLPAAQELDAIFVPVCTKEGGGPARAEALPCDFTRGDPRGVEDRFGSLSKTVCNVERGDMLGLGMAVIVGEQWGIFGGIGQP